MRAGKVSKPRWMTETLHRTIGIETRYEVTKILQETRTETQHLVLFENPFFGTVLMLDGAVQLTLRDEFIYHEMITHVPLLAHGAAARLLIIGGGDGGVAREALKHQSLARITQVEIDAGVVDFCKKVLPQVSDGAFDNPRLDLIIGDGAAFVKNATAEFDVIIVDSTDPVGPGAVLFTSEFYESCAKALAPGGLLITQNGVPFLQPQEARSTMAAFANIFADRTLYLATIPTYVGGPMAFGWGTDNGDFRKCGQDDLEKSFTKIGLNTRYYTPAVHQAAFALPGYVAALLDEA